MAPDFKAIDDCVVGYELKMKQDQSAYYINHVRFGEFIVSYIQGMETSQEVYDALRRNLKREIRVQDGFVVKGYPKPEWKGFAHPINFLVATLRREAILNSMRLIDDNYLQAIDGLLVPQPE